MRVRRGPCEQSRRERAGVAPRRRRGAGCWSRWGAQLGCEFGDDGRGIRAQECLASSVRTHACDLMRPRA
eukprot:6039214-Pleurochrysis_carterae.AAC.1